MNLRSITIAVIAAFSASVTSAQVLLVKKSGESVTVYNTDLGKNFLFYTLSDDSDAAIQKIPYHEIQEIRLADGSLWTPESTLKQQTRPVESAESREVAPDSNVTPTPKMPLSNPGAHPAVTHYAAGDWITDKKGDRIIAVSDGKGQYLAMKLLSSSDRTLAVTRPDRIVDGKVYPIGSRYALSRYVIPDYVIIGADRYTVTEIDDFAMGNQRNSRYNRNLDIQEIIFPSTLKRIGRRAFLNVDNIRNIYLPDGLEEIAEEAFTRCGRENFVEVYVPKSVRHIGENAFLHCSDETSPFGYAQFRILCMPDFVNEDNSEDFGIDDDAIETYLED